MKKLSYFAASLASNRKDDTYRRRVVLLGAISFIYEFTILFFYFMGGISVHILLALHMVLLGYLARYTYRSHQRHEDIRHSFLLFLAVLGAGPFGALGFLILSGLYGVFVKYATSTEDWLEQLFPEEVFSDLTNIFQRIEAKWDDYGRVSEVSSFQDIFNHGSLSQKQAILDAIVKDFNPIYFPIVREALNDSSNVVRIQAAAIVNKIDLNFEKDLHRLLISHKESPADAASTLKIAEYYDAYAGLGILDSIRQKENQEEAIRYYREYLKEVSQDGKVFFSIGRLLFICKNYEEFILWYGEYKSKYKIIPKMIHMWYLEVLHRLHRYEELIRATREF